MIEIRHQNYGWLHAPPFPPASCHCLLVRIDSKIALIDTGIGMQDVVDPIHRIGREAIDAAGFQFLPEVTATRQILAMGWRPEDVTDIVLTHADPDHVGGLSDFPAARVHVSAEEKRNLDVGNPRYRPQQFAHSPHWVTYSHNDSTVCGLPARRVATQLAVDVYLVPLFGHTLGHCGVAVRDQDRWLLHVGDAYYLREELDRPDHPVSALATLRADDNERRLQSLSALRQLIRDYSPSVSCFGYHDVQELPAEIDRF